MNLYQFTYVDNQNLPEADLKSRVSAFLNGEAELQGWAPGYSFKQSKSVEKISDGSLSFSFEVFGEYLDSESLDQDQEFKEASLSSEPVAARDAEL